MVVFSIEKRFHNVGEEIVFDISLKYAKKNLFNK